MILLGDTNAEPLVVGQVIKLLEVQNPNTPDVEIKAIELVYPPGAGECVITGITIDNQTKNSYVGGRLLFSAIGHASDSPMPRQYILPEPIRLGGSRRLVLMGQVNVPIAVGRLCLSLPAREVR